MNARPQSPFAHHYPPPISPVFDEEASLPLPRRDPRDIPDVQLLILEPSVAQSFINWVEQGFRAKGLRASTIWLSPRLPLNGLVKRQIIEGVQAVVKLAQSNQYNSRIPLQVFDRAAGASNVNFNEYADLDVSIAADIVVHARQKERAGMQHLPPTPQPYTQGRPPMQYGHHPPPPQYAPQMQPNYAQQQPPPSQYQYNQPTHYPTQAPTPATPVSNASNLQQLLANLRQPGEAQTPFGQTDRPASDLAGMLGQSGRPQAQGGQYLPPQPQPQPQQAYGAAPVYGTGQPPQQNVQNIMETLARYNR
jgi:hypothetical protein